MGVGTVNNNGGVGGVLFQTNSENGRVKQNEDYMLINSKPNGKLNALGIKQNANVYKVSSASNKLYKNNNKIKLLFKKNKYFIYN
jgi:hypothetical protein